MQHGWISAFLTTALLAAGVCGYHGGTHIKYKEVQMMQTVQIQDETGTNGQNGICLRDGSCGNECVNQGACLQGGDCAGQRARLRDGSCADDCVNAGVCPRDGSGCATRMGASR